MARTRTVAGAGTITTAALVLIFGNQIVTEWIDRHSKEGTVWGWFLRVLSWPRWAFQPRDSSNAALRDLLAQDLRALFLILFVALILTVAAKTVSGGAGGFLL